MVEGHGQCFLTKSWGLPSAPWRFKDYLMSSLPPSKKGQELGWAGLTGDPGLLMSPERSW